MKLSSTVLSSVLLQTVSNFKVLYTTEEDNFRRPAVLTAFIQPMESVMLSINVLMDINMRINTVLKVFYLMLKRATVIGLKMSTAAVRLMTITKVDVDI